jgi:hypothetical protein
MEVNMRWWYVAGLVLAFVVGSMVGDAIGTYHCVSTTTTTGQGSAHLAYTAGWAALNENLQRDKDWQGMITALRQTVEAEGR